MTDITDAELDAFLAERWSKAPGHSGLENALRAFLAAYRQRPEVQAMERDAVRYRWLRSQPNNIDAPRIDVVRWEVMDESGNGGTGIRFDELDEAIDAALAQSKVA